MPTNADESVGWAVDTSVAVAYLDGGHAAHDACVAAVGDRRPVLAGHAAFESYSVLTRLPEPARVSGTVAIAALEAAFPGSCWLSATEHAELVRRWGRSVSSSAACTTPWSARRHDDGTGHC